MSKLDFILEELVTANRILANEGIVDSFGHVSARHPDDPQHYLLSRARAPERIERDDIVEYSFDGTAIDEGGRAPYLERFIHGAKRGRTCTPWCTTIRRARSHSASPARN